MAEIEHKTQEELGHFIEQHFAKQDILNVSVKHHVLTMIILRSTLLRIMQFLRDDPICKFSQLIDITAVHYPEKQDCFTIVYQLLSPSLNQRICIKMTTDKDVSVASVTGLFPSANWYEREVREMFGISFDGHPDLRSLLTYEGLTAHPMLKNFPLEGIYTLKYDSNQGKCEFVKKEKIRINASAAVDLSTGGSDGN